MATYVAVMLSVPGVMVGMSAVRGADEAVERRRAVAETEAKVVRLRAVAEVRAAAAAEAIATVEWVEVHADDPAGGRTATEAEAARRLTDARRRLDAALAARYAEDGPVAAAERIVAARPLVPVEPAAVASAMAAPGTARYWAEAEAALFEAYGQLVNVTRTLRHGADAAGSGVPGAVDALVATAQLHAAVEHHTRSVLEVADGGTARTGPALGVLRERGAVLQAVSTQDRTSFPREVRAAWAAWERDPATVAVDRVAREAAAGDGAGTAVGSPLSAARSRDAGAAALVATAFDALDTRLGHARAAADRALVVAVAALVGTISVTAAVAVLTVRRIVQPLCRLACEAEAAVNGAVTPSSGPLHRGPREVAVVGNALADLVALVHSARRCADLLAAGDVASARGATFPGPIGTALAAAVDRLSDAVEGQHRLAQRLAREAALDPLTGLANRTAGLQRLAALLEVAAPGVSVLFCDLDGFKQVNDQHGHAAGDAVLSTVAQRILDGVGDRGLSARWGGDEFLVVLDGADERAAVALAEHLVASVGRPVVLPAPAGSADCLAAVGCSVGVTTASAPADPAEVMAAVDGALYRAKAEGRGTVRVAAPPGDDTGPAVPPAAPASYTNPATRWGS